MASTAENRYICFGKLTRIECLFSIYIKATGQQISEDIQLSLVAFPLQLPLTCKKTY